MYRYEAHAILKPGTPGTTAVLRQSVTVTILRTKANVGCALGVLSDTFVLLMQAKRKYGLSQLATQLTDHQSLNRPTMCLRTLETMLRLQQSGLVTRTKDGSVRTEGQRANLSLGRDRPDSPCPGPMVLLSFVSLVLC